MAGKVRAIDRQSVHQICSGQVVLNLATAVKELVENSLDAGATNVEVRLKNHGSELLEVIDNGSGVKEENFEALTLKHHTSKLNDFSDLAGVSTFGFRGEALSSLCALSDLIITTCHTSVAIGTKLEYDHDGILVKRTPISRQPGTTVTLQNLFSTFPVRHKEFLRNVKKEFGKMVHLLQAYCLISTGVRITCTNQVETGRKNIVAQTHHNSSIRDNVSNVYGPKSLTNLLDLKQSEPSTDCCEEFGVKVDSHDKSVFSISGYISSCEHGCGRSSSDRQYYFINSRPCDFPKVSKLVNEVYHMYNRHQYPMVVLNITLDKDYVDVNLTPDKRKILVQEEKTLLAVVKTSLVTLFESRSGTYQLKQPTLKSNPSLNSSTGAVKTDSIGIAGSNVKPISKFTRATLSNLKRSFSYPDADKNGSSEKQSKCPKLDAFFLKLPSPTDADPSKDHFMETPAKGGEPVDSKAIDVNPNVISDIDINKPKTNSKGKTQEMESFDQPDGEDNNQMSSLVPGQSITIKVENINSFKEQGEQGFENSWTGGCESPALAGDLNNVRGDTVITDVCMQDEDSIKAYANNQGSQQHIQIHTNVDEASTVLKKHVTIPFSLDGLKNSQVTAETSDGNVGSFYAAITPADNGSAESELVHNISKDMFSRMEILGQFNLGFIIVRLKNDLFIIDQHATDEKYNFETFQRTSTLQSQKLIQPLRLELTAVDESILMDNIDIFQKNGFEFEISEDALPTQKVKLVSLPICKNWTFGTEDINEMIFMLMDAPGTMCRPSRVRQMFASRACRSSVMIGTALNQSDMKKLVHHMGEIDQPWNCPHGRPTMRHLINLKMLPD